MKNKKVYVIAEIGLNHDGKIDKAIEMVHKSKESGADAVKFQTFKAEHLLNPLTFKDNKANYNIIFDKLKEVEINEEFHKIIREETKKINIDFISSVFDQESLEIVNKYCDSIKIASSEITNLELLEKVGETGKKVIISTGMATLGEIERAIFTLLKGGATDISLLHCVSLYPLEPELANLMVINSLKKSFKLPVGFSDHSLGDTLAIAAVALGATIIEKHVTLKRENRLFDHPHSMEFKEFEEMVNKIREIEIALGDGVKKISAKEMEIKKASLKSLFAKTDIKEGEVLNDKNIKAVRPLIGIPVEMKYMVINSKAKKDIPKNSPIFWEDIVW
ncbi:MAG TPA: N-acetylneuraminate synthase family protein [Spirochaetota bacterium]|nr:N-acetylneuraminate synthase family protein [Spirochaetota bacterium]HOM37891.1 N-acetylneuraminate synthase family protein [Spirochaetota bacterium]HPQ48695.1 N-acetylneuraminate synthase family protein [Spirochaetota bacterium]